jgi:hypothetical protein
MPIIRDSKDQPHDIAKLKGNFAEWRIKKGDVGPAGTDQDLRSILTAIFGQRELIISQLIVEGFCNEDYELDLLGIVTKSSLKFKNCHLKKLQLADASLRSLYVIGGKISEIEGTRLKLSGSFDMSPDGDRSEVRPELPTTCIDYLELSGAEIGGNLDLENVTITGKKGGDTSSDKIKRFSENKPRALRADGIKVRGNLLFGGVKAKGELRINGCEIGRNVDLQRTRLTNEDGYAVSIAGGEIKGDLSFRLFPKDPPETASPQEKRKTSEVKGAIRLSNSKIVGRVYLSDLDVTVVTSGRRPDFGWLLYGVEAEGVEIGATLHTERLTLNAPLNLEDAVLKGGWIGKCMKLRTGAAPALIATGLEVAGLVKLEALDTNSFISCVRAEFRGGLVLKGIDFSPNLRARNLKAPAREDISDTSGEEIGDPYLALNNWRRLECGLNLDRATILGSFELDAIVTRWEGKLKSEERHTDKRAKSLDKCKQEWQGVYTWLCLDGATLPEIDKTAIASFNEFDFVDLINCDYKSVITRHSHLARRVTNSSLADQEFDHWRRFAKYIKPLPGVSSFLKQKRDKLIHLWNAPQPDLPRPFLDKPSVETWLKILDSEYAPLAWRSDRTLHSGLDLRPRWAQGFGILPLSAVTLLNGLLVLGSKFPKTLLFIAAFFLLTVWNDESRTLGAIFLVVLLTGLIVLALDVTLSPNSEPDSGSQSSNQTKKAGLFRRSMAWFTGIGRGTSFTSNTDYLLRHDYRCSPQRGDGVESKILKVPVFHPQPYLKLARTMRDAGFDRDAAEVIIAMEWRRIWYGDLSAGQKALQFLKGWFLEFGFNRMRPVKWQFIVILVSALVFQFGYYEGAIVPSKSNEGDAPQTTSFHCSKPMPGGAIACSSDVSKTPDAMPDFDETHADARAYVSFNALLFAAETVLPLTDFGQRKNWIVEPVAGYQQDVQDQRLTPSQALQDAFSGHNIWETVSYHFLAFFALLVTAFGSLMTTLFVAGILGVITPKY